jgi:putative radical SAM enzyme (TIGR03279 family)
MKSASQEGHPIRSVARGSAGARLGARAGDILLAMNGEPVIDEIDDQFVSAAERVELTVRRDGETLVLAGRKRDYDPLGLTFARPLNGTTRTCRNRCAFCFVDQLPRGMRESLYVKDDDWRLSLRSGHYITLTNVGEEEFARILARRASPLYISVHATDPAVRIRLLGNPRAGDILARLRALAGAGLKFHAQIVLCPGYNDGEVFRRTIGDLAELHPFALSVAAVPVGLTKHREGLPFIAPFTPGSAAATIDAIERMQRGFLAALGTRFVFAADEM